MTRYFAFLASFLSLVCLGSAKDFDFYPKTEYSQQIPTLQQIVGHGWGEKITSHGEMEKYIRALAEASPNIVLEEHGETWEGRTLYHMIVASEQNLGRLDEIKSGLQRLADPRTISDAEATRLIESLPSVAWLAYGVHGNEISSTDAGLLTAYHLAASQTDTLAKLVLANSVVILDPLQNPDGRDRFVNYYRQTRGAQPDPDQQAAEHNEAWPGGRTNHYLFDMNRDWFALTQPETQGRVRAYLEWFPQVFVDLHEMGSNSTYYFAPPADPMNPEIPKAQNDWLRRFGRNNAKWFDRMKFDYFTREVYDSFYPGYGEGWPMFHGSIGMTYEQASARGLVVKREDETTMHYRDAVQHHFISSLSTAETAARNHEDLLRYFYEYRKSAIAEGAAGSVKEYILPPGNDPNRTDKLVSKLVSQGIEVRRAQSSFRNDTVRDYFDEKLQSKQFPAGTYLVTTAQPTKRLIKNLLDKHTEMDEAFIQEQIRRYSKRLRDEIYDITGWSLPLLYDVECYTAERLSRGDFTTLDKNVSKPGTIEGGKASLAYTIPWGSNSGAKALALLLQAKIRAFASDKGFTLNGVKHPRGSLIVKVKNNPEDLHGQLAKIAQETGVKIYATNTSWVDEGANFGSRQVNFLKPPKVAMAYHMPTSAYSVGWARYVLEREYGYPVTIINTLQLGRADLTKYNVLILPHASGRFGGYKQIIGENGATRVKQWVRDGGTLITIGDGTRWLTDEKVGLLATNREFKGGQPDKPAEKEGEAGQPKQKISSSPPSGNGAFDLQKAIQPEKELPGNTPGTIMRVALDTEHWVAFGYDGDANVMVASRSIYTPLKLDKGRNVGVYMEGDKALISGFTWEETQKQIASKAYLMHQPHGRGHVVAFAEDPNYRAFCDGLSLLFLNAVFFGPAH